MQDGQNLFDATTSYSGEWGVDETLDLVDHACIVVGIDNGGSLRLTEYNPNYHAQNGAGEGMAYLQFIVKTLKPFIDSTYRTLRSAQSTFIAGSSMGGLISFYAGLYHPQVFGGLGIFSPAFWIAPTITRQVLGIVKPKTHGKQRYYFYGGGKENPRLINDILQVKEILSRLSHAEINTSINDEGEHNEMYWGKEFLPFYHWISKQE